jgi:hypothetical protein
MRGRRPRQGQPAAQTVQATLGHELGILNTPLDRTEFSGQGVLRGG